MKRSSRLTAGSVLAVFLFAGCAVAPTLGDGAAAAVETSCTVTVTCRDGAVIRCTGTTCEYRADKSNQERGFVRCDAIQTDCNAVTSE